MVAALGGVPLYVKSHGYSTMKNITSFSLFEFSRRDKPWKPLLSVYGSKVINRLL